MHTLYSEVRIEPLYSVERSQRLYPEPPTMVTSTFVGVRATYGVPLISAELEVAQSTRSDSFPLVDTTTTTTTQRAMLGIRSFPIQSNYFGVFLRAGARAQQQKIDITQSGTTTTDDRGLRFDPYAGTGVTIAFSNIFALNAGVTLVYNERNPASEQYDTQYNFSFTFRTGNR